MKSNFIFSCRPKIWMSVLLVDQEGRIEFVQ